MAATSQLDLRGISWPVCLLNFKQNLLALPEGECLEVLVQDPEVADQIHMIVERSADQIIDRKMDGDGLRLRIKKGKGAEPGKTIPHGSYDSANF